MDSTLGKLIIWPDRETLRKTMPECFRASFGTKVALIIDCFEVFIERPSNLLARASTWSSYKHHNTIKILLGIAPQGVVTFVSEPWGGRVSDKHLTEQCGVLNNLLPGDIVLADRGFDIAESVGVMQAKLHIPAFTKGKSQLSAIEVEETRTIANVRIHVERVIGNVRQTDSILQRLPLSLQNSFQPPVDTANTSDCGDVLQLMVTVVESVAVMNLYISPDDLVKYEAVRKCVPHTAVGGTCSTKWSHHGTSLGIYEHVCPGKTDTGLFDVILSPV